MNGSEPNIPSLPKNFIMDARKLIRSGDLDDAKAIIERGLLEIPDDLDLWVMKGEIEVLRRDLDSAILCFEEALSRDPVNRSALLGKARSHGLKMMIMKKKSGRDGLAEDICNEEIHDTGHDDTIVPEDQDGRAQDGRDKGGRDKDGRDKGGRDKDGRAQDGRAQGGRAQDGRAETGNGEVINGVRGKGVPGDGGAGHRTDGDGNSGDVEPMDVGRGDGKPGNGNTGEGMKDQGRLGVDNAWVAELVDGKSIESIYERGIDLGLHGEMEKGIELLSQVLRSEPHHHGALWGMCQFLYKLERFSESKKFSETLCRAHPNDHVGYHLLGLSCLSLGDLPSARDALIEAIHRKDDDPVLWKFLGIVLGRMGHNEKAFLCYDQSMSLNGELDPAEVVEDGEGYIVQDDSVGEYCGTVEKGSSTHLRSTSAASRSGPGRTADECLSADSHDRSLDDIQDDEEVSISNFRQVIFGLKKKGGGGFFATVYPTHLLVMTRAAIRCLVSQFDIDGVVVCCDRPPRVYRRMMKKDVGSSNTHLIYVDLNASLAGDAEKATDVIAVPQPFGLESLEEAVDDALQRCAERFEGQLHFVLYDNISALLDVFEEKRIVKYFKDQGQRMIRLHMYGIYIVPEGSMAIDWMDRLKRFATSGRLKR